MINASNENVLYLVQKRFREVGEAGRHVRVHAAEWKNDPIHGHEWWLVRVEIDVPLEQLFRYYVLLSEVEEQLESQDGLNTLIVPTIPEEQAA